MTASVKTAMVLAAGLGTRMRPLTDDRPKPMIEVGGKPLIDWILDDLSHWGITTAIVNLHYKAEALTGYLADRTRPRVVFSDETEKLLDTGGGVAKALSLVDDECLVITNSDALWLHGLTGALTSLKQAWSSQTMDALLLLASMDRAHGFDGAGDFFLHDDGTPERRGTRPQAPTVYAGTQIVHRRLFEGCPEQPFSFNLLWDQALTGNRLKAVIHEDDWFHVGTPDAVGPTGRALTEKGSNL